MNDLLRSNLENLDRDHPLIPASRKAQLKELAAICKQTLDESGILRMNFICTHNSRRSQIAQLLAWAAAEHFTLRPFQCYSGGSEATAFNPRAVDAMRRAGFLIDEAPSDNPHYLVRTSLSSPFLTCFSKTYDDPFNPPNGFVAVMVCSDADANCPVVIGASARFPLPYVDPKRADGTPEEHVEYDRCAKEIGREIVFLLREITVLKINNSRKKQ